MFQKAPWILLLCLYAGCWNAKPLQPSPAPSKAGHPLNRLTYEEKEIYWKNRDKAIMLRSLYARYMSLRDSNNMVTPASTERFLSLFEDYAKVWNDLLPDPLPVSPADYVAFVRNFLPKGVDAELEFDGRSEDFIDDPRFFRYYRVGQGKNEYYMHFLVIKKMHVTLNKENRRIDHKPPKVLNLEMVFHFDDEKNTARICEIKPMSN